jgi:hypothetical protein
LLNATRKMLQRIEAFKVEYRPLRFPVVDQMPTPAWSARWRRRCRGRAGSGAEPITPRNLACRVPKSAQPWVLTLLRTIFDQPDAAQVHAQFDRVVDALSEKFPDAAEHLDTARADLLAFTAFPRELWRQIWSNNPQERLNKEIRRRTDVVGIFPDRAAVFRLVGAVLPSRPTNGPSNAATWAWRSSPKPDKQQLPPHRRRWCRQPRSARRCGPIAGRSAPVGSQSPTDRFRGSVVVGRQRAFDRLAGAVVVPDRGGKGEDALHDPNPYSGTSPSKASSLRQWSDFG